MNKRYLLFIVALLLPVFLVDGRDKVYTPSEIPNVQLADSTAFVSDPASLLSAEARMEADLTLLNIRLATTAEGVAVVVPSIGDLTPTEFCEKIFTSWGIGKRDKDNGFILLIATDDRQAWIQTGYGLEGVLPDAVCSSIIREEVVPYMKEGNLDAALVASLDKVWKVLADPAVKDEIMSRERRAGAPLDLAPIKSIFYRFLYITSALLFILGFIVFVMTIRKTKGKSQYEKALAWKGMLWSMIFCMLFTCGAAAVYAVPAIILYRRNRFGKHKCPCCGTPMRRLNEKEDNAMLSPAQDLEERLDTVDYDVWVCPECGAVDRLAFKKRQKKYSRCENCGAIADRLVEDHTIVPATTRQAGVGERIHECANCHHRHTKRYTIPRKPDVADAAAAAAILGSMAGRGRGGGGGGGFGGGGFGGGSTGGGGGGASW